MENKSKIFSKLVLFLALQSLPLGYDGNGKPFDKYLGVCDADTIFNLGSVRERLAAVAIACLVTGGEVHWYGRVDTFLDELHDTNDGNCTIMDYFSHWTSLLVRRTLHWVKQSAASAVITGHCLALRHSIQIAYHAKSSFATALGIMPWNPSSRSEA
ncbi:D-alanyl-d-alanine carboxypeptidase [Fusarium pseudocircinatum]|uniref:D-alanyl-d-alanine carboxypeptidase n=1 Tax=Fusarium pseudocircinatum TaxID=56676 RepID=A0A8H5L5U6_9HYPO|nr:D-alanyl-d-alanine carboxypeptidase [Fusarium pseudocircinatum]